jgi:GTP-binding protein LepA
LYPESQDEFTILKQALTRLKLSDSSLSFEEDGSSILGKGFRCGFLGMLHLEIVTERLRREFNISPVITTPSIRYEITDKAGSVVEVFTPLQFPEFGMIQSVKEQWVKIAIITPPSYLSPVNQLLYEHESIIKAANLFGDDRMVIEAEMPLRELMRGFFDKLKSVSSGFASLSYEFADMRAADVLRMDILVAEEEVPAFSRVISRRRIEEEARSTVEKLKKTLPRQMFVVKIQAKAAGRIVASESISAMRKDVTGYLYGGDVSRKKKLLEKQKKGKERRGEHKKMNIPQDVFLKMVKPDSD